LAEDFREIEALCNTEDDNDLLRASAALALSEAVMVAGLSVGLARKQDFGVLSKSLKITFKGASISQMTRLKEQFHVTRQQIAMLGDVDSHVEV
jgi:hypothetical protein